MPDTENYWDDQDLADFIIDDDGPDSNHMDASSQPEQPDSTHEDTADLSLNEDVKEDRISAFNNTVHSRKSQTSQILKAHISVLVSALGGPDHSTDQNLYKLGHDALACLKDLKRWIRTVDEQNATFDVALACAETGLVENDLIVILCQWDKPPAGMKRTKAIEKISLACLELLVLLTWPVEVNKDTLLKDYTAKTENRRAQLRYKHAALSHKGGKLLKAVLRLGLNALKIPKDEREPRDINILRLILFFIRNLLFIEPLPAVKGTKSISNSALLPNGVTMDDISLPTILQVFDRNNVLLFLTSMAHSVSSDLKDESFGLLTIECLFFLTKGVMTEELTSKPGSESVKNVTSVPSASAAAGMGLEDLLSEESRRLKHQNNSISSRHGRFGTLLSIQNSSNASYFAVSGQKALLSNYDSLQRLDKSKKWHKTSSFKYDSNKYISKSPTFLGTKASGILMQFINNLLTSGSFNNLVSYVGSHLTNLANDNDLGRKGILDVIDAQELAFYFGTISWFFKFKRESMQTDQQTQDNNYGAIGASLGEIIFILLISYFRSSYQAKDYNSLQVAMICLREMLLISNAIFAQKKTQSEIDLATEDDINEDRELAEGIIRKLFSQKEFLDLCVNIPKTAAKHSPEYLKTTISVVNILLKSFEILANEDVHLYLKTRRRIRKLKKTSGLNREMDREHLDMLERSSDEEDEEQIKYIVHERKLDYKNMEVKFFHTDIINTHIDFLKNYEDLTFDEIKKGISFFHRLFVARKDYSALYRLDFMLLLHRLQEFLPKSTSIRRHVDEFLVYFMKKFKGALDRFPTAIEVLFPRIENLEIKGFISTGDITEHEKLSANNYFDEKSPQPKAAIVLDFINNSLTIDQKISILIYNIIKSKPTTKVLKHLISEFQRTLMRIRQQRFPIVLRFNLAQRKVIISDPHIRLLLEISGFDIPFLQNDDTTFTSRVDQEHVQNVIESIEKWLRLHEAGVGDIEPFLDQLQRVIFSQEELDFGADSLRDLLAGRPINELEKERLEMSQSKFMHSVGLAKRKEYDESIATTNDEFDDEFVPDSENQPDRPTRRRRRARALSEDENEDDEDRPVSKRSRRRALPHSDDEDGGSPMPQIHKSAEFVNDSEDDSDEERNNAFFEKEERLRQLIAQSGGIVDKVQLQLFKESWASISGSNTEVSQKIKSASSLFLDSEDEEETQEQDSVNQPTEHSGRSRRVIVEDDEDEL